MDGTADRGCERDDGRVEYLCQCLSRATGLTVRLFRGRECVAEHGLVQIDPDPVGPYVERILETPEGAGMLATPLGQLYGYVDVRVGGRAILGPTLWTEEPEERELLAEFARIGVSLAAHEDFYHALACMPSFSVERLGWLVMLLASVSFDSSVFSSSLSLDLGPLSAEGLEGRGSAEADALLSTSSADRDALRYDGYLFERLVLSYVRQGSPEGVRELFASPPTLAAGTMSRDQLRQAQDTGICSATIASRAAIEGGVDVARAFEMSDRYIQGIELMRDVHAIEGLRTEVFAGFAEEVRRVRAGTPMLAGDRDIFELCAKYVSRNIYRQVRIEDMAREMGYTRGYLSTRFKKATGSTLSHYILAEKIYEAKRLLEFTGASLADIAEMLAFSSQSHFQTVFKRACGETPAAYRRRVRHAES